nr:MULTISPECIES: hypothetical protein [unclassified Sphingopyxis]
MKLGAAHIAAIEFDPEQRRTIDLGKGKVAAPETRLIETREGELRADVACVVDEGTILENRIAHIDIREAASDQADLGQASILQAGSRKLHVAQHAFRQRRAGQIDFGKVDARKISVFDHAAGFEFHRHLFLSAVARADAVRNGVERIKNNYADRPTVPCPERFASYPEQTLPRSVGVARGEPLPPLKTKEKPRG